MKFSCISSFDIFFFYFLFLFKNFSLHQKLFLLVSDHNFLIVPPIFFFFFSFGGNGIWTQGLTLVKQELYHLTDTSSPFCFGYFGDRVLQTICLDWPQTVILHILASQVSHQHLAYFLLNFFLFSVFVLCWGTLVPISGIHLFSGRHQANIPLCQHSGCHLLPWFVSYSLSVSAFQKLSDVSKLPVSSRVLLNCELILFFIPYCHIGRSWEAKPNTCQ
jgi:hypothetical protein